MTRRAESRDEFALFYDRPRIYATDVAHAALETTARLNLSSALVRLAQ